MADIAVRPDLQAAYDRLGKYAGAKKSLGMAHAILRPDEVVTAVLVCSQAAASGSQPTSTSDDLLGSMVEGGVNAVMSSKMSELVNGILVLSNRRLFFVLESKVAQERLDWSIDTLESVGWSGRMMTGTLSIAACGGTYQFNAAKKLGSVFADQVRSVLSGDQLAPRPDSMPSRPHSVPAVSAQAIPGPARNAPRYPQVPQSGQQPRFAPPPQPRPAASAPAVDHRQHATPQPAPDSPSAPPRHAPPRHPPVAGPPPGWLQNPDDPTQKRWWDGQRWTEHVQ